MFGETERVYKRAIYQAPCQGEVILVYLEIISPNWHTVDLVTAFRVPVEHGGKYLLLAKTAVHHIVFEKSLKVLVSNWP